MDHHPIPDANEQESRAVARKPRDATAPRTFRLQKIRSPYTDPKYSVDHGPLPQLCCSRNATEM